jgi:hypothetical protein
MSADRWATHVKNWHALQRDSKKCSEMAAKVHEDTKRMANVLVLPPSDEKDIPMAIPDTEVEHAAPVFIEGKMTDERGGLVVADFSSNPTKLEVKVGPVPSVTFSDTVHEASLVLTPAEEQHAMELLDTDLPSRKRQRTTLAPSTGACLCEGRCFSGPWDIGVCQCITSVCGCFSGPWGHEECEKCADESKETKEIPLSLTEINSTPVSGTITESKPLVPPLKRLTKAQLEELGYIFVEKDSMDEKE